MAKYDEAARWLAAQTIRQIGVVQNPANPKQSRLQLLLEFDADAQPESVDFLDYFAALLEAKNSGQPAPLPKPPAIVLPSSMLVGDDA